MLESHVPELGLTLDSPVPGAGLTFWAWIALGVTEVSLSLELYRIPGAAPRTGLGWGEAVQEKLLGPFPGASAELPQPQEELPALEPAER